jgi:hypothetical protein
MDLIQILDCPLDSLCWSETIPLPGDNKPLSTNFFFKKI